MTRIAINTFSDELAKTALLGQLDSVLPAMQQADVAAYLPFAGQFELTAEDVAAEVSGFIPALRQGLETLRTASDKTAAMLSLHNLLGEVYNERNSNFIGLISKHGAAVYQAGTALNDALGELFHFFYLLDAVLVGTTPAGLYLVSQDELNAYLAENHGRDFGAIEINSEYFPALSKRWFHLL